MGERNKMWMGLLGVLAMGSFTLALSLGLSFRSALAAFLPWLLAAAVIGSINRSQRP